MLLPCPQAQTKICFPAKCRAPVTFFSTPARVDQGSPSGDENAAMQITLSNASDIRIM
jgi:hypothetical protein